MSQQANEQSLVNYTGPGAVLGDVLVTNQGTAPKLSITEWGDQLIGIYHKLARTQAVATSLSTETFRVLSTTSISKPSEFPFVTQSNFDLIVLEKK